MVPGGGYYEGEDEDNEEDQVDRNGTGKMRRPKMIRDE